MTEHAPERDRGRTDGDQPATDATADDVACGAPSRRPREGDGGRRDEAAAPPGADETDETVAHDVESVRARGGAVSPHDHPAQHDAPPPTNPPRP